MDNSSLVEQLQDGAHALNKAFHEVRVVSQTVVEVGVLDGVNSLSFVKLTFYVVEDLVESLALTDLEDEPAILLFLGVL